MMKDETMYDAIPISKKEEKDNSINATLIIIGLLALLFLLIWAVKRINESETALCLDEVIPMLET